MRRRLSDVLFLGATAWSVATLAFWLVVPVFLICVGVGEYSIDGGTHCPLRTAHETLLEHRPGISTLLFIAAPVALLLLLLKVPHRHVRAVVGALSLALPFGAGRLVGLSFAVVPLILLGVWLITTRRTAASSSPHAPVIS